jgi:hypothetical protein
MRALARRAKQDAPAHVQTLYEKVCEHVLESATEVDSVVAAKASGVLPEVEIQWDFF